MKRTTSQEIIGVVFILFNKVELNWDDGFVLICVFIELLFKRQLHRLFLIFTILLLLLFHLLLSEYLI